jgi:predicted dithiol-disulfide oxidoreductase (DUF899 family)
MDLPRVVSQSEWLAARKALLVKEKELTRQRDALSAERRRLPMVKVEEEYVFDGPDGPTSLRDLFGPRCQLVIYHFMFDPSWDEGCPSCSHFADSFSGAVVHLAARNTSFAVISRAPLDKIESFKKRMGWSFPWLSSSGTEFNRDFQVTLDQTLGSVQHNFANAVALVQAGKLWSNAGEFPGLSVFLRDGDAIFRTYSTYQRGMDAFLLTYNFLDVTPLGRQDAEGPNPQAWIRHHDRYPV